MNTTSITLTQDAVKDRLNSMLTLAQSTKSSARLYPIYQQLQIQRFMAENASEGVVWDKLKPEYSEYKKKRYSSFPGGGSKTLIATSTLAGAVIGPGAPFEGIDKHRAMFQPYSMQITVEMSGVNAQGKPFTYPEFVATKRPFMKFSEKSIDQLKSELQKYLIGK